GLICAAGLHCDLNNTNVCIADQGEGADCVVDTGCGAGLFCTLPMNAMTPVCMAVLDGDAACDPTERVFDRMRSARCPDDMICDGRSLQCVAAAVPGDPCFITCSGCGDTCPFPLHCTATTPDDGGFGPVTGTCQRFLVLGEACTPPPGSEGDPCNEGRCD